MFRLFKRKPVAQVVQVAPTLKRYFNQNAVVSQAFRIPSMSAKEVITRDYLTILKSARYQLANNDYIQSYVKLMKRNVIGDTGVMLRMDFDDLDQNQSIEDDWKYWCKYHQCDSRKQSSFTELLNQFLCNILIDGECFILLEYRNNALKLKLIDSTRFDVSFSDIYRNIVNGIGLNAYDEPITYFFKNKYGGREEIAADRIIHSYRSLFVGQRRGVSNISNVIGKLEKLDKFENAALNNAEKSAKFLGFVTTAINENMQPDEDLITDDGDTVDMGLSSTTKEREELKEPTIAYLNDGEEYQSVASQYPSGEMRSFNQALLHSISAGLGISYQALTKDIDGMNFAAGRTGTLEDQNEYKMWQTFMIESLIEPIFSKWAELYTMRKPNIDYASMLSHSKWQGRRWTWVDPKKDGDSNSRAVKDGLMSRSEVIRKQGGVPSKVFNEIAKEQQQIKALGIKVDWNNPTQIIISDMEQTNQSEGI